MTLLLRRSSLAMSIEKLRTLARELAGEAWTTSAPKAAQAQVPRQAAKVLMTQADTVQREDGMFEYSQAEFD